MRDRVLKMVENRCRVLFICIFISLWTLGESFDAKAFDDSVLFKLNWPGKESYETLQLETHQSLLMTTINNEKFSCVVPQTFEHEQEKPEVYAGPTAMELLLPILKQTSSGQTPCSYRLESYWTYELCHGKYMRQFHEDREGKKHKLQEYYLGKWDSKHLSQMDKNDFLVLEESQRPSIQVKKIDGLSLPYLQINMSDGTLCDLSGKPRSTRVQYVCYQHGKHEIYSLKETSTCEYEAVVLSPLLCQHPNYRPQETGENQVSCYPVEGAAKKPKNLLAMEAESLKLRHQKGIEQQKILEKDGQKIVVSISPIEGQDKVRVEIKSFDVLEDGDLVPREEPTDKAQNLLQIKEKVMSRKNAVNNFLDGKNCLIGGTGWWKYEFCYGQKVEQYHEEKDGSRTSIPLGIFDLQRHRQWLNENPHKRPKPLGQRKQVSHLYSSGSFCEKVNKPRQVEVKLKCLEESASSAVSLYLLEPRTCEYLLGVESTVICDLLPFADEDGMLRVPDLEQIRKVAELMMDKIVGADGAKITHFVMNEAEVVALEDRPDASSPHFEEDKKEQDEEQEQPPPPKEEL